MLIKQKTAPALYAVVNMDGYETDDILSQTLDLAEENDDNEIFITQSTFQSNEENVAEQESAFDIGVFQLLPQDECEDLRLEECVSKEKDEVDTRFRTVENEEVDAQSKPYIPVNTVKKANWAKNMYNSWCLGAMSNAEEEERRILQKDLLSLTDGEIISLFPKFIMSVRRKDCGEYKSDTIFSIITSIQKYYEINGKNISLLSDMKFNSIRNCVSNTMRQKVQKGIGLFKRQAQVIPKQSETRLKSNKRNRALVLMR